MAEPKLPLVELGHPGGLTPIVAERGKKPQWIVEALDLNPELQFPLSIPIYDAMRSQDGHVGSVINSIVELITSAKWQIDEDGVRPEVAALVRSELGLQKAGEARARRRREGVSWKEHIATAAETFLWAGFCAFEQTYLPGPARPDQEDTGLDQIVHLRKLAPRLPRTVTKIETDRDGGIINLYQANSDPDAKDGEDIPIPITQLVVYTRRREGADWYGRSILRQAYKYWLIKDVFLRLDAQAAERGSMGVPKITVTDEGQQAKAEQIGADYRAGANAFVVLPPSMQMELMGISGNVIDLSGKMAYLDQEIARSALAMFLDLGHDAGARSLGETFWDIFVQSVQSTADALAEVATEHIVRDLVEANFGVDEPYPVLTPGNLASNSPVPSSVVKELIDAGLITPDEDLELHFRNRYGLPAPKAGNGSKPMSAEEMKVRGDYAQGLIRSGFEPAAALEAAGLTSIKHLGLLPVTLQPPAAGTDLPNAVPPVEGEPGSEPTEPPAGGGQPPSESDGAPFVDARVDPIVPAKLSSDPIERMAQLVEMMAATQARHRRVH